MKYPGIAAGIVLVFTLFTVSAVLAVPSPPRPTFFSPQPSPDGRLVLWESLERDGSVWISGPNGEDLRFVVKGHSPSWDGDRAFRYVRSVDDGHEVLQRDLYRYDLDGGLSILLAKDSDNDDYKTVQFQPEQAFFPDRPLAGKVVCLDPGHGKNSGAYSKYAHKFEDYYGLQSAMWVKDYLEESGATVKMTRVDNSICPALSSRVNYSNSVGAKLFTSFHYNAAGNHSAHGLEVYHRSYNSTSKRQARLIHDRMKQATGLHSRGVKGDKQVLGFYLGVLSSRHKTGNRTLTEGAFLTNQSDAALVDDPKWNESLSYGIYCGICDTLGVTPEPRHPAQARSLSEGFGHALSRRWIGSSVTLVEMETPQGDSSAALLEAPASTCRALRTGGPCWNDYRVDVVLRPLSGEDGAFGIMARCSAFDSNMLQSYVLVLDEAAGKARLLAYLGAHAAGAVTLASTGRDAVLSSRSWHRFTIECKGRRVRALVDGVELQPTGDASVLAAAAGVINYGKVGIYLRGGSTALKLAVDSFDLSPIDR